MDWVEKRLKQRADARIKQSTISAAIPTVWRNLHVACADAVAAYVVASQGPEISQFENGEFFIAIRAYSTDVQPQEVDRLTITLTKSARQITAKRKNADDVTLTIDIIPAGNVCLFHGDNQVTPEQASKILLDGMFFPEFSKSKS